MTAQGLGKAVLSAVFPDRCAYCGEVIPRGTACCPACATSLMRIDPPVCPLCGCGRADCGCGKRHHPYDRCVAPFYYEGPARSGILRMKERERPYIIEELACQMAAVWKRDYGDVKLDGVAFIPMIRQEERRRGFNQSRLLAGRVADIFALPLWAALSKIQETRPQKSLTAYERSGNVLGAFDADPAYPVKGKRLLLVDDLVSTGSTAGERAKVLKLYGAAEVSLLTAAVNRLEGEETKKASPAAAGTPLSE